MTETEEQKKKDSNMLKRCIFLCILVVWSIALPYIQPKDLSTGWNTIKTYSSLDQAYSEHKNFIWHSCVEWLKLISPNATNFDGPTYNWEFQWKYVLKWTSDWILFRCEFVPEDNEWWMNLNDVKWEI